MTYIKIIMIIPLSIGIRLNAQFNQGKYHKNKHSEGILYDREIKKHCQKELTSSYFVITYPVMGATTSWVPQFITCYNQVKNNPCDKVIVMYNNGGLRESDIPFFIKTMFNMSDSDLKKLHIIVNDTLFKLISGNRTGVRLQYYFRGQLVNNENEKWHDFYKFNLPTEHIDIKYYSKTKITGIDSLLIFERDKLYPFDSSRLIILSDALNLISFLELHTGKITPLLNFSKFYSAADLYCNYISEYDTSACQFARINQPNVANTNRKVVQVDGLKVLNDTLILYVSIEVFEKNREKYTFRDDEGRLKIVDVGAPILSTYNFIVFYNMNTKKHIIYPIRPRTVKKNSDMYILPAAGSVVNGDTIIISYNNYKSDLSTTFGITQIYKSGNAFVQSKNIIQPSEVSNPMISDYHTKTFFIYFNDRDYIMINCSGVLYQIGKPIVQSQFYGNGSQPYPTEIYKQFSDDSVTEQINFRFHTVSAVLNGKYLLGIGRYKNQIYMELKNSMLETIDIIDPKYLEGFKRYASNQFREDILIYNDEIIFKCLEDGEMYLYRYRLKPVTSKATR